MVKIVHEHIDWEDLHDLVLGTVQSSVSSTCHYKILKSTHSL